MATKKFAKGEKLFLFTVECMAVLRIVNFERKLRTPDEDGNDCVVNDDGLFVRAKMDDIYTDQAEASTRVMEHRSAHV